MPTATVTLVGATAEVVRPLHVVAGEPTGSVNTGVDAGPAWLAMRREPIVDCFRMALASKRGDNESADEPAEQPPPRTPRIQGSRPEIELLAVHDIPSAHVVPNRTRPRSRAETRPRSARKLMIPPSGPGDRSPSADGNVQSSHRIQHSRVTSIEGRADEKAAESVALVRPRSKVHGDYRSPHYPSPISPHNMDAVPFAAWKPAGPFRRSRCRDARCS